MHRLSIALAVVLSACGTFKTGDAARDDAADLGGLVDAGVLVVDGAMDAALNDASITDAAHADASITDAARADATFDASSDAALADASIADAARADATLDATLDGSGACPFEPDGGSTLCAPEGTEIGAVNTHVNADENHCCKVVLRGPWSDSMATSGAHSPFAGRGRDDIAFVHLLARTTIHGRSYAFAVAEDGCYVAPDGLYVEYSSTLSYFSDGDCVDTATAVCGDASGDGAGCAITNALQMHPGHNRFTAIWLDTGTPIEPECSGGLCREARTLVVGWTRYRYPATSVDAQCTADPSFGVPDSDGTWCPPAGFDESEIADLPDCFAL